MNTHTFRTTIAAAALVLMAGCGTAVSDGAQAPRSAPQEKTQVDAGATYDGWIVRSRRESTPPPCPWSPDQVERMQESGQPLPGCVLRLQHWFQNEYDPSWLPAGRADH